MIRIILVYGAIGALIVGTFMVVGMTTWPSQEPPANSALVGYLTIILALTTVFLGVKHYRDRTLGGVIKFLPAFLVGLGISAVASLGWVIGWEISLAVTGLDFPAMYSEMMLEQARGRGATDAELQRITSESVSFAKMYANPLFRVPITFVEMFPVGVIISLISALLLRNSRFMPARRALA
jgi:hypothetical protein